jgi:hypothetical protein
MSHRAVHDGAACSTDGRTTGQTQVCLSTAETTPIGTTSRCQPNMVVVVPRAALEQEKAAGADPCTWARLGAPKRPTTRHGARCQTERCWMLQHALPCVGRRPPRWTRGWLAWLGPTRFGAQSPAPRALLPRCAVRTENTPHSVIVARLSVAGDLLQTQCFKLRQGRGPVAPWRRALYVPPTI